MAVEEDVVREYISARRGVLGAPPMPPAYGGRAADYRVAIRRRMPSYSLALNTLGFFFPHHARCEQNAL